MAKTSYFLAKSDPDTYSLQDLKRDGRTTWDGVKNPQALAAIRTIEDGDCVVIYHSQDQRAVVGWAYAEGKGRPDPDDPKLAVVDLRFGGELESPVSLTDIKASGLFQDFLLVRNGRLSTMAAPPEFIQWLKKLRKDFTP